MLCPRLQTIIGPLQFITMIAFTFYKASSLLFLEREEMILEIRFICQCANSVSKIADNAPSVTINNYVCGHVIMVLNRLAVVITVSSLSV